MLLPTLMAISLLLTGCTVSLPPAPQPPECPRTLINMHWQLPFERAEGSGTFPNRAAR